MVGAVRLELMTSCMSSMRSNQLSYVPNAINNIILFLFFQAFSRFLCILFFVGGFFIVYFPFFAEDPRKIYF